MYIIQKYRVPKVHSVQKAVCRQIHINYIQKKCVFLGAKQIHLVTNQQTVIDMYIVYFFVTPQGEDAPF